MNKRGSGILLHITSLPSSYGIGDLGPAAYTFADFLSSTKQSYWQILPTNPTDIIYGNSPYSSISAFAGNPLLISPEVLVQKGFLDSGDITPIPDFPNNRVDYTTVTNYKNDILSLAFERFTSREDNCGYEQFCAENDGWLDDYSIFAILKHHINSKKSWNEWPLEQRDRDRNSINSIKQQYSTIIKRVKFRQYLFFIQWFDLKQYCNERGIQIIGDIPIYIDYESADVWTHSQLFNLDENKNRITVAGVPPDYFSETGQLWGNPVYKWDVLKQSGYNWWLKRIEHNTKLFDLVRIDHFRGLVAYWEVAANEETAINGDWVDVPVYDFFNTVLEKLPYAPIIAEDLGIITEDVSTVINHFDFPGMKILMFAFGDSISTNPYIPHNFEKNCIVYTGTHDNNTVKGWFDEDISHEEKENLSKYLGCKISSDDINWALIRTAMMSIANTSIFPLQDVLGLGKEARMNLPSTSTGNWEWRFVPDQLTPQITETLLEITEIYKREQGREPLLTGNIN